MLFSCSRWQAIATNRHALEKDFVVYEYGIISVNFKRNIDGDIFSKLKSHQVKLISAQLLLLPSTRFAPHYWHLSGCISRFS